MKKYIVLCVATIAFIFIAIVSLVNSHIDYEPNLQVEQYTDTQELDVSFQIKDGTELLDEPLYIAKFSDADSYTSIYGSAVIITKEEFDKLGGEEHQLISSKVYVRKVSTSLKSFVRNGSIEISFIKYSFLGSSEFTESEMKDIIDSALPCIKKINTELLFSKDPVTSEQIYYYRSLLESLQNKYPRTFLYVEINEKT